MSEVQAITGQAITGERRPDVSICMRTFNRPDWLEEAIQSVLRQEGASWELLITDNGSDPNIRNTQGRNTREILRQHCGNPRVRIVELLDENSGSAHLRLYQAAVGRYITNLPDDDILVGADSLARRVQFLDEHPNCGFVFSSVLGHTADRQTLGQLGMGKIAPYDVPTHAAPFNKLVIDCFVPWPSAMFRAEWTPSAWTDPKVMCALCAQDWSFWLPVCLESDQGYLAEPTVSLRQHPNQDSHIRGIKGGEFLEAHLRVWERWSAHGVWSPSKAEWALVEQTARRMMTDASREYAEARLAAVHDRLKSQFREGRIHLLVMAKDDPDSNEAHCLQRCLDSCVGIVNRVTVMLTAANSSWDSACEGLVMKWGDEHPEIGLHIFGAQWTGDFSQMRNRLLENVMSRPRPGDEWALLLDADEVLMPSGGSGAPAEIRAILDRAMADLNATAFLLPVALPDGQFGHRAALVKLIPGMWKYRHCIHETIEAFGNPPQVFTLGDAPQGQPKQGIHIYTPQDGARSRDPEKRRKDIEVLRRAYDDTGELRYALYLGDNLAQLPEPTETEQDEAITVLEDYTDAALEERKMRKSGHLVGPIYHAMITLHRLYEKRGWPVGKTTCDYARRAYELDPTRAEAPGIMAEHWLRRNQYATARTWALTCIFNKQPRSVEYLEPEWAAWRGAFLWVMINFKLGLVGEARASLDALLQAPGLPELERPALLAIQATLTNHGATC